ncbi:hypothetical protein [Clostridium beijerinckii]|uniref:hypothetical protein n=1 Tax=Clostridium beijerinckii TaxID=1520 RepID=UPI0015C3E219|nr:hypothetical protein [Clostridium beijerinckii]
MKGDKISNTPTCPNNTMFDVRSSVKVQKMLSVMIASTLEAKKQSCLECLIG